MTAPKIGERHLRCMAELVDAHQARKFDLSRIAFDGETGTAAAEIIAKHFPDDDSWVERAAWNIAMATSGGLFQDRKQRIIEIINGCRRD